MAFKKVPSSRFGAFNAKIAARLGYVKDEAFCKDCKQVRHFKAKRLDDLEEALKNVPDRQGFGGNTLVEEDGEIKLVTFTSKAEALTLIDRARKGRIAVGVLMPQPTEERLQEVNDMYESRQISMHQLSNQALTLKDGVASIKVDEALFGKFLKYLGSPNGIRHADSSQNSLQSVEFKFEGGLNTYLDGCRQESDPQYWDNCLQTFSGPIEESVLRTAMVYMGETHNLIKHKWFLELKPINMWMYLSYPIISEIGNALICRNLFTDYLSFSTSAAEFMRMPRLSFKGLIQHYYKTKSPRLIKALGKLIIEGHDVERVKLDLPKNESYKALGSVLGDKFMAMRSKGKILEQLEDGSYIIEGRPKLRNDLLLAGPMLTNLLPLDMIQEYFEYVGSEAFQTERLHTNSAPTCPGTATFTNPEVKFLCDNVIARKRLEMLKSIAQGKELKSGLRDLISMLAKYQNPTDIPESLRSLWPDGMKMPKNCKTIKEAHDIVSKWDNQIREERQKAPIEYGLHEEGVDGKTFDWVQITTNTKAIVGTLPPDPLFTEPGFEREHFRFKIVLPRNTVDLIHWGKHLKNCIASYAEAAVEKRCTLGALYKVVAGAEDELYGTFEVRWIPMQVYQGGGLLDNRPNNLGWAPTGADRYATLEQTQNCTPKVWQCVSMCNKSESQDFMLEIQEIFKEAHEKAKETV